MWDERSVTLRHPTMKLEVVVRERLARALRRVGYTDVEPGDEPLAMKKEEENEDGTY